MLQSEKIKINNQTKKYKNLYKTHTYAVLLNVNKNIRKRLKCLIYIRTQATERNNT